jgi:hypothetical protein
MENNLKSMGTMFNAMFPILNVSQVYVSGIYMPKEHTAKVFYEAFRECQSRLEEGSKYDFEPEWYIEQLKKWAKQTEETIFMSLLTYHPEKFYPQQIDALPEDLEFWEGLYKAEQWEQYDEAQHPFFDSWLQEMQDITQEMWQEF